MQPSRFNTLIVLTFLCTTLLSVSTTATPLPHIRPAPSLRKFNSSAVNNLIANFTSRMIDSDLATLFENCYPCTLDTTVQYYLPSTPSTEPSSFVITGDITAQWFRDSANQLLPYVGLLNEDETLRDLTCGLILRHSHDILHDPYANAYNFNASGAGHQDDMRKPPMTKEVFEGKYELDSLAAVMKLATAYYNVTQDSECFLQNQNWLNAIQVILQTIQAMQVSAQNPVDSPYLFQRVSSVPTESQILNGMGRPTPYTGMSRSPFRPSDDATTLPFLIPSQAMAVVELRGIASITQAHVTNMLMALKEEEENVKAGNQRNAHKHSSSHNTRHLLHQLQAISSTALTLASEIDFGIQSYGLISTPSGVNMYAYEVDGYGSTNLMDDANCPSLLSLPYLGYTSLNDPTYLQTRSFVWSEQQPFFWSGLDGEGIGGPHEGMFMIWPVSLGLRRERRGEGTRRKHEMQLMLYLILIPTLLLLLQMSIIMYALTSTSDTEISWSLSVLKNSSAGTGYLHESYNKDNVTQYTRPWFAWVNGLFGELIVKVAKERPYLIFGEEEA